MHSSYVYLGLSRRESDESIPWQKLREGREWGITDVYEVFFRFPSNRISPFSHRTCGRNRQSVQSRIKTFVLILFKWKIFNLDMAKGDKPRILRLSVQIYCHSILSSEKTYQPSRLSFYFCFVYFCVYLLSSVFYVTLLEVLPFHSCVYLPFILGFLFFWVSFHRLIIKVFSLSFTLCFFR